MIQYTFFVPLYRILSTDNKYPKLIEWIMVKYIHEYNYHNFFTTLIIKYMFSMNLVYKYVNLL